MDAARAAGGKRSITGRASIRPRPWLRRWTDTSSRRRRAGPGCGDRRGRVYHVDHLIVQSCEETDLNHVWLGQSVDITFDSFPIRT